MNVGLRVVIKKILPADKLSQVILGGQDGLVNTFGVILGVAAASSDIRIVIAGGLAACFAESISMGAVAYTSQKADHDHYLSVLESEKHAINNNPEEEIEEVKDIYRNKGFKGEDLNKIVNLITSNKQAWLSIMMSEEKNVAPIEMRKVYINSSIVLFSSLLGSLVPLTPFFFLSLTNAIYISFIVTTLTLFLFGYYKGRITVGKPLRSGIELLVIGMTAAMLGYVIGLIFS